MLHNMLNTSNLRKAQKLFFLGAGHYSRRRKLRPYPIAYMTHMVITIATTCFCVIISS